MRRSEQHCSLVNDTEVRGLDEGKKGPCARKNPARNYGRLTQFLLFLFSLPPFTRAGENVAFLSFFRDAGCLGGGGVDCSN